MVSIAGSDATADLELVNLVRSRTPLLLGAVPALQLLACVRATREVPGAVAEAGVFAGGSAKLICEAKGDRELHLFDVFETLQREPAGDVPEATGAVRSHFQRVHAREADVRKTLDGHAGVSFHTGVFPKTAAAVADTLFSFVHLDLDLEAGTLAALEFFYPRLAPGALLVADDFGSAPIQAAFRAYFHSRPATIIGLPWSQGIVVSASTGGARTGVPASGTWPG
ncbi:MAG TPA: TylF/MycF/NovP-related O-methyltransferase [Rhodanobacteraceae bacterium]|nr:TylF/MycF/NovP-related O-methyltransferase [Rhodanobacteraceae bacterium]